MKLWSLLVLSAILTIALWNGASVAAQESAKEEKSNPMVIMKTNMGTIKIELFEKEAPITVKNFLGYVDKHFYDGTTFHRVVPGFVIQGGGYDKDMMRKVTLAPIKNEANNGLKNLRGTLSMARTQDINSATSQFFINLKDNPSLDHKAPTSTQYGYAVFGRVVEGMDVVDKIAKVKTTEKASMQNVPVNPVIIESVTRWQETASKSEPKQQ